MHVVSASSLHASCFKVPLVPNNRLYTTMSSDMSSPIEFPETGFEIIDASKKFEEETLPDYDPADYYPAQIGQVLTNRYQIVGKLGYGVGSTAWLARDNWYLATSAALNKSLKSSMTDPTHRETRYVSLKICTANYTT